MLRKIASYQATAAQPSADPDKRPTLPSTLVQGGDNVRLELGPTKLALIIDLAEANDSHVRETKTGKPYIVANATSTNFRKVTLGVNDQGEAQCIMPDRAMGNVNIFF